MTKLVTAVALALILAGCGAERPPTEAERYETDCHKRGGYLSKQDIDWNMHYNCIGQTIEPQLPELIR